MMPSFTRDSFADYRQKTVSLEDGRSFPYIDLELRARFSVPERIREGSVEETEARQSRMSKPVGSSLALSQRAKLTLKGPPLSCFVTTSTPKGFFSELETSVFSSVPLPFSSLALKNGRRILPAMSEISTSLALQDSELGVRRMVNLSKRTKV